MSDNKKYIDEYQTIRIIATILVVVGHVSTLSLPRYNGGLVSDFNSIRAAHFMEIVRYFIYSFHMPLFVTLSGAIFGLVYKYQNGYIVNRAKRLLIPAIFASFFWLLPVRYLVGYYGGNINFGLIFHDYILTYDINYLWYVVMLFEVTTISVVTRKVILSDNHKIQILVFCLLLMVSAGQFFLLNNDSIPFQIVWSIRYLFWFYLGILINKNFKCIKKLSSNFFIVVTVGLVWIVGTLIHIYFEEIISINQFSSMFLLIIKIVKMFDRYLFMEGAGTIFWTLLCFKIGKINNRILKYVGDRSFFIYLYHCPFIYLLKYLQNKLGLLENINNLNYIILLTMIIVLSITLSLMMDYFLQNGIKKLKWMF